MYVYVILVAQNRRRDRDQRPELYACSVEFVAPNDYQIRPPQPPTYLFVVDVSQVAVANGMLTSAVAAIKAVLREVRILYYNR
jgi:protein transport protein SEC24